MEYRYGKPIPLDSIREFETKHQLRLPSSYIEVVTSHDGASLTPHLCDVIDPLSGNTTVIGCHELIPFVADESTSFTMERANSGKTEGLPKNVIAFGIEAGGILFAFDYRKDPSTDDPPIVCYFGEYEDEFAVFPAASSFDSFISGLRSDDTDYPPASP